MRQIKFRALYNGGWYYQTLEEMLSITFGAFRNGKHKTQFTGLTDRDSKEIYEGDKLKDFATGVVVTVEFVDGSFCVIGYEKFAVDLLEYLENSSSSTYIIGNIYED